MTPKTIAAPADLVAAWTVEQAFVALLYAAALVDGEVHPDELEEITALGHRLQVFEKHSSDADMCLDTARARLDWNRAAPFPWTAFDAACAVLAHKQLGETVFANACDIIFADRVVTHAEVDLVNRMAERLQLNPGRVDMIIEAIKIKNGHGDS
jgi:uncharacterized tellurite resistance protein B-like protein